MYRADGLTITEKQVSVYAESIPQALDEMNRVAEKILGEVPEWKEINFTLKTSGQMRQGRVGYLGRE